MLTLALHSAAPTARLRKWSFSRSKEKKAQDNHFVRTNRSVVYIQAKGGNTRSDIALVAPASWLSGRWIKTEHALMSTDDEDDELRKRRERQDAEEREEQSRQQSSAHGHHSNHDHGLGHYETTKENGFQDGPVVPPWHLAKPPTHWHSHPVPGPSTSGSIPNHQHSQSQPVNSYFPSTSTSESPIPGALLCSPVNGNGRSNRLHTPPAPVPFPSMNYITQPSPKVEAQETDPEEPAERHATKESRRVKYKPGSLYPLHNPIQPDRPYTNLHLRPPDFDLPPIFIPKGFNASGGGANSGSSGGAPPHDRNQSSSANETSGMAPGTSPVKEGHPKRESKDGRSHPPTTQPPTLQQSTSAILGHSASAQSLSRLAGGESALSPSVPYHNLHANAQAVLSPRTQAETALHQATDAIQARALSPTWAGPEPGTLDVSDPLWGTNWSHASPYDLGRTPLTGIRIPAPSGGGMSQSHSAPNIPQLGVSGRVVKRRWC